MKHTEGFHVGQDCSERLIELENTKKAMMNLLEDLELEKNKIAAEEARDAAILASVGEGLVVTDIKGNITLVNKMFEQLLGLESKDVIGKSFVEIVPATDQNGAAIPSENRSILQILRGISENKTVDVYETIYYKSNKRSFPVALNASPVVIDGLMVGAVEVFRDITKEQEIDRAKSEFVSLAGHQLRTPISIINWYTELIYKKRGGKMDEMEKSYIDAIYQASKRMGRLVNQLLNVSRMELGTLTIEPVSIDLVEFLDEIRKYTQETEQNKKQKCEIRFVVPKEPLPRLSVDPDLLRQVFMNILTNAVLYAEPDKGCRITMMVHPPKENFVVVSVQDEGIGIPAEVQPKIFQRMFRADNAVSHAPDGTGLGLYFAKKIMDDAEGNIWFESEEGKGTTFFVSIPLLGMKTKKGTKKLA